MAVQRHDAPWTYEDLLALPDDGKRYEIIEGELFALTGPNLWHVTAVANLTALLLPYVSAIGGRFYPAVFDLFLVGANPVQPDLAVTLPGSTVRRVGRGVEGPPDLVIEVISPSNRVHDVLTKRALYGRAGVREYWIVDPVALTVEIVTFADGPARSRTFAGDQRVVSEVLPNVDFPTSAVFADFDTIEDDAAEG